MKKILTEKVKEVKKVENYTYESLVDKYKEQYYGEKITHAQLSNILKRDGKNVSVEVVEKLLWSLGISVGIVFQDVTEFYPETVVFNCEIAP